MYEEDTTVFVEVGPKRALTTFCGQILKDHEHVSIMTNHPKQGGQHLGGFRRLAHMDLLPSNPIVIRQPVQWQLGLFGAQVIETFPARPYVCLRVAHAGTNWHTGRRLSSTAGDSGVLAFVVALVVVTGLLLLGQFDGLLLQRDHIGMMAAKPA